MVWRITFSYLGTLHIDFYNAESTYQIGIDTVNTNTVDSFITSHQLIVEVTDIGDIAFQVYQVDI